VLPNLSTERLITLANAREKVPYALFFFRAHPRAFSAYDMRACISTSFLGQAFWAPGNHDYLSPLSREERDGIAQWMKLRCYDARTQLPALAQEDLACLDTQILTAYLDRIIQREYRNEPRENIVPLIPKFCLASGEDFFSEACHWLGL